MVLPSAWWLIASFLVKICVFNMKNLLENTCIIDPFNLRGLVPSTPSETLEHRYPGCGGEGAPYLSSFLSESCDNLDTTSVASLIPHELQEKSHFLAMARRLLGLEKGWWPPPSLPRPGSCYQNIPITLQKERRQCSPHSRRVLEGLMPDPLFSSLNVAAVQCCPIPTSPIQSVSIGKPSPKSKIWDSVWKGALTNTNQVSEKKIGPGWSLRVGVLENPLTNCQLW